MRPVAGNHQDAFVTPGMFPAVAAILNRCRQRPNSENTPPPRPVSVHLFFTAVGRVARGNAFSLSIACPRTLESIVSFLTM